MKKTIIVSLLLGILSGVGWAAFEWPDHHCVVRINGEVVTASWKDGKPYVFRQQTMHLLHVRSGPDEVDLAKVLDEQGFQVTLNEDGSIDCNKTQTLAVEGPPPSYNYDTSAPPSASPAHSNQKSYSTRSKRYTKTKYSSGRTTGMVSSQGRPSTSHQTSSSGAYFDISASRAQVESIGQELAVQCRRPISWTFTVVEKSEPNAWTPGEGTVFITTGLLRLQLTKDEIAGILGHEIAHGARQHLPQRRLQDAREDKADRDAAAAQQRAARAKAEYQREMSKEENQNPNSLGALNAKDKYEWEMHRAKEKCARSTARMPSTSPTVTMKQYSTTPSRRRRMPSDWGTALPPATSRTDCSQLCKSCLRTTSKTTGCRHWRVVRAIHPLGKELHANKNCCARKAIDLDRLSGAIQLPVSD